MALTSQEQDVNRPDYRSKAYQAMAPGWQVMQDLFDGEDAVKRRGKEYLQRFTREQEKQYDDRLKWSPFYNITQPSVIGVVGNIFSQSIAPQKAPPAIAELFSDIDCCGNDLDTFLRETMTNAVRDGHSAILVDAPPPVMSEGTRRSRADVRDRRPYWVNYRADQILSALPLYTGGRTVLGQVVLKEMTTEKKGLYGEQEVIRYRVIRRDLSGSVSYSLFEEREKEGTKEKDIFPVEDEQDRPMFVSEIPLYAVYARQKGFWMSEPPYLGLARLNLQHYNEASLYQRARHYLVPMLWVKYQSKEEAEQAGSITMGSNSFIKVWGDNGAVGLLESSSNSGPIADEIVKIEERMARLGIEKFSPVVDGSAKTAFEVGSDNRKEFSEVALMAKNLENAVESAFEVTAEFINAIQGRNTVSMSDADKASLALNIEYDRLTIDVNRLRLLHELVNDNLLRPETFIRVLFKYLDMPDDQVEDEINAVRSRRLVPQAQAFESFLDSTEVA